MKLSTLFNKPHPFIFTKNSLLVIGFSTFFVLLIFAPFGYHLLPVKTRLLFATINSLIACAGVWFVILVLKRFFAKWSKPEQWTTGKEILLILSGLSFIIILTFFFLWLTGVTKTPALQLFIQVIFKTVAISIVPIIILVFSEQYSHQQKKLKQAIAITEHLKKRKTKIITKNPEKEYLILTSTNESIDLKIFPNELLYIKSEGNYLDIYYLPDSINANVQKKLIRNSLKTIIGQLPNQLFFHCHKSYIVNLNHIIGIKGNARNLELSVRGTEELIPVSRSKTKELQQRLEVPK